MQYTIQGIK